MKNFFENNEWIYRAARTFFQAAIGVVVASIAGASGIVDNINWQGVIVLAVSTGVAALMNINNESSNAGK